MVNKILLLLLFLLLGPDRSETKKIGLGLFMVLHAVVLDGLRPHHCF